MGKTALRLKGEDMQNDEGNEPWDCGSHAFREQLELRTSEGSFVGNPAAPRTPASPPASD